MAETLAGMFGSTSSRSPTRPTIDELDLPAPRLDAAGRARRRCARPTRPSGPATPTASRSATSCARFRREFAHPPDVVARPARRGRRRRPARLVRRGRRRRDPVRRRLVGRRRRRVRRRRRRTAASSPSTCATSIACSRSTARRGAARIQAGVYGPALEDQLRPHGLTLRHFPQSFEFSTLGGWLATRSGGHYATLYTHIDDFVESLRVVTPRGVVESRPAAGLGRGPVARPHVPRLRGHPRRDHRGVDAPPGPADRFRASATARFADFDAGRARGARARPERPATRRTAGCSTPPRR